MGNWERNEYSREADTGFDVVYNRETTENKAYYFKNSEQLIALLSMKEKNGDVRGSM